MDKDIGLYNFLKTPLFSYDSHTSHKIDPATSMDVTAVKNIYIESIDTIKLSTFIMPKILANFQRPKAYMYFKMDNLHICISLREFSYMKARAL